MSTDKAREGQGKKSLNAILEELFEERRRAIEDQAEVERLIRRVAPLEAGITAIICDAPRRQVMVVAEQPDLVEGVKEEVSRLGWDMMVGRAPPAGPKDEDRTE